MKYIKCDYNIAMDKYQQKKYQEVIDYLNNYLSVDKNNGIDAKGLFVFAKAYDKLNKKEESIKIYKIILDLDPNNVHARLELGKLYAGQGKVQEAESLFKECMQKKSNDVYARLELGKLYAEQGKTELSKEMYDYILDSLEEGTFDEESRLKHILRHTKDSKTKKIHWIF